MTSPLTPFDLREIPFSRRGSWLNLSPVLGAHAVSEHVHLISHVTGMHPVLSLVPQDAATLSADPSVLTWHGEQGTIRAVFETTDTVRLRGDAGTGIRLADARGELTPFTGTYLLRDPQDGAAVFTSYESGRRYRVTVLVGEARLEGDEALGAATRGIDIVAADTGWEAVIEELETSREPYRDVRSFETSVAEVAAEFLAYADAVAGWRSESTPAAGLAAYVLWSATVSPAGFLGRESVLMSKHWMDKVWSWDHCFNALALAPELPDAAWDQFLAPFDHQEPSGALPDSITHSEVLYNFVKPPIHGWALDRLRADGLVLSPAQLREAYDRLSAWTRFWLDRRCAPGHDLPAYQHGNDSGWDNSTAFDHDRVVESPDLAAFLLLQLDCLARLAEELSEDPTPWRTASARVHDALTARLWREDGFVTRGVWSDRDGKRTSLLTVLPIVAGPALLGPAVTASLGAQAEHFLTEWGLATELVDSEDYESDGYWRGPIWAPSTMLVEDGLRRSGLADLADEVSARFRRLCEASGFAENFDALTGVGLRDRAYTWTAAVYLVLAREATRRSAD